jgi:hypothetical protein
MQYVREVGTERSRDAGETGAYAHTVAALRFDHEVLGGPMTQAGNARLVQWSINFKQPLLRLVETLTRAISLNHVVVADDRK